MKLLLSTIFLANIWFSTAFAESVSVRAGEHSEFTRVVLYLPHPMGWSINTQNGTATLTLDDEKSTFDTSSAFEKITKNRLAALSTSPGKGSLILDLNCNCEVSSFLHTDSMLVIDIKDERPIEEGASPITVEIAPIKKPKKNPGANFQFGELSQSTANEERSFHLGFGVALGDSISPSAPNHPANADDIVRLQRVKDAELRLIEQIGRAATQGLLTVNDNRLRPSSLTADTSHDENVLETNTNVQNIPSGLKSTANPFANVNLRAESSIDHELAQALGSIPQTKNGDTCLLDAALALETWGTDQSFGQQLGEFRGNLVGEFDRPNQDAALGLAKMYLYFGFGAEAINPLKMAKIAAKDRALILSLARIMEQGFDPDRGPLHGQLECDTSVAFWSAMAYLDLPPSAEINIPAILRTLNTIPLHLRVHLGPTLSERLVRAGEAEAAASVLRILGRGMEKPDARIHMAEAVLELSTGDLEAATQSLDAVVTANTEMSPQALVNLIDTKLTQGEAITPNIADLAGAFAHEQRDQPIGQELRRVHILALADAARFDAAMQELSHFKMDKTLNGYDQLRTQTVQILAEKSDDLTFLEYALRQSSEAPELLAPNVANLVANRLIDIGFNSTAAKFIQADTSDVGGRDRRVLRARLALAEGRPRRAEAEVLGLKGYEIDKLRAKLRSLTGDHMASKEIYSLISEDNEAMSEAWLAEDWDYLAEGKDPILTTIAKMMKDSGPTTDESASPSNAVPFETPKTKILAQNRELLDSSLATREMINTLLQTMLVDTAATQ